VRAALAAGSILRFTDPSLLKGLARRFALDRTPLQRMHLAMLLSARLPGSGLVPPAPASPRAPPGSNPCYQSDINTRLPMDLFSDHIPDVATEAGMWHASCPAGALSAADADAITTFARDLKEIGAVPLNAEQRDAVAAVVVAAGGRKPFTLFGPPGKG